MRIKGGTRAGALFGGREGLAAGVRGILTR